MELRLKDWWILTTTTYAAMMLSFCAFSLLGGEVYAPALSWHLMWQGFVLCGSIAVLQLLWFRVSLFRRLPPKAEILLDVLLRCLLCVVTVYVEGVLFGFFPMGWASLWMVLPALIPTFVITYSINYFTYARARRTADFINRKINGQ